MLLLQFQHKEWHQVRAQCMNRADPKRPGEQTVLVTAEAADDFGLFQNLPGMPHDFLADCRDMDAAVGPLEKRRTELFLEFVNLPRECWLADKTALGSLSKVQGFADGDEVFKVAEVHLDNRINRLK